MPRFAIGAVTLLLSISFRLQSQIIFDTFDPDTVTFHYYEFSNPQKNNWRDCSDYDYAANSGVSAFLSDNGNQTAVFKNLGIEKDLGGRIEEREYRVSFYIAKNYTELSGVETLDFSTLYIGRETGSMIWDSTVSIAEKGTWYKWTGRYIPAVEDAGKTFVFKAVFNLEGRHSIALDGPITVDTTSAAPTHAFQGTWKTGSVSIKTHPNTAVASFTTTLFSGSYDKITGKLYNLSGRPIKNILHTSGTLITICPRYRNNN